MYTARHLRFSGVARRVARGATSDVSGGFTLVEILVALAIFAILGALGYRALGGLFDARAAIVAHNQQWRALELFFSRLERDLHSHITRPVRNEADRSEAAFFAPTGTTEIAFTRAGWSGANGPAADAQRVGYRWREQNVELLLWPVLDRAPRTAPSAYTVLRAIKTLEFRFLDASGNWQRQWGTPPLDGTPKAVEVALETSSGKRLTRLMALP